MTTLMDNDSIAALCRQVSEALRAHRLMLVTAESCTGGGLAKVLTDLPGSSGWFERGFVTYSNAAKIEMLGVAGATLESHGAVSEQAAAEMAAGALAHSHADIAVAVTGIAGPEGGTPDKPVGTVWLAWVLCGQAAVTSHRLYGGDRKTVRRQSVIDALRGVIEVIDAANGP